MQILHKIDLGIFLFAMRRIVYVSGMSKQPKNAYKLVSDSVAMFRGHVINYAVYLERLMDDAIGIHLCVEPGAKVELMNLILATERITFESKRQVLLYIITEYYPDFISKNPNFFKNVKKYGIEERNHVAHLLLDTQPGYYERWKSNGDFRLISFKISRDNKEEVMQNYDTKIMNDILKNLYNLCTVIRKFNESIGAEYPPLPE